MKNMDEIVKLVKFSMRIYKTEIWIDKNSNDWYKTLAPTKAHAEILSKGLVNCRGCLNCENCINCTDCVWCKGAKDCTNRFKCKGCIDCNKHKIGQDKML